MLCETNIIVNYKYHIKKITHVLFTKNPTVNLNMFYTKLCCWVTAKNGHWLNCILPRINKILKKKKKNVPLQFISICRENK